MRAVEVPCRFASYAGTAEGRLIEQVLRTMDANYGLAGPAFMDALFTRRPGAFAEAADQALAWDARHRQVAEERFWTYGLGLTLAAGRLACETGFLDYDMDALEEWVLKVLLPRMRITVGAAAVDGQGIMTMFLNENLDSTLVVASAVRQLRKEDGHSVPASVGDGWLMKEPSRSLNLRLELDTRTVYVGARYFEAWCLDHRISCEAVVDGLAAEGKHRPGDRKQAALGQGVKHLSMGQIVCYIFKDLEVPDAYLAGDT
jgi:hypothetical protein